MMNVFVYNNKNGNLVMKEAEAKSVSTQDDAFLIETKTGRLLKVSMRNFYIICK